MQTPESAMVRIVLLLSFSVVAASPVTAEGGPAPSSTQIIKSPLGYEVEIRRDGFGVPHIYADTDEALFYGAGYAVAQDRLSQLEYYRRAAEGRLAEILGDGELDWDLTMRRDYYTQAERQAMFDSLDAEYQTIFTAYGDGINARITEVLADREHKLPSEFWELGITPVPWTVTNSVAIVQMMVRNFGEAGGRELENLQRYQTLGDSLFNLEYPINDPTAPTTIPSGPGEWKTRRVPGWYVDLSAVDSVVARMAREKEMIQRIGKALAIPLKLGSFAAVVNGTKSGPGNAMLLGAPQMGYDEPQIANEMDLHGGGFHVAGMNFAGIPGILIGHNADLAWTTTSGVSDNVDIYIEELNPDNFRQCRWQGAWRDMEVRTETIPVLGGPPSILEVRRTVHGPVFDMDLSDPAHPVAFTKRRVHWARELSMITAFIDMNRARNVDDFNQAMRKIVTSHNFMCADMQGDVAYWHAGDYPIRAPEVDPRLPSRGTGQDEWLGFIPFEDLPQARNPAQMYFANWNNKPSVDWDHGDNTPWIGGNGVTAIMNVLAPDDSVSFQDMKDIPRKINDKGTYMQVVELSQPAINAVNILPPGQSGFIDRNGVHDLHFFDQKELYFGWDYKPMLFLPVFTGVDQAPAVPVGGGYRLMSGYPNPLTIGRDGPSEMRIPISVARATHVRISVLDVLGRVVRVLLDESVQAGVREIRWNGRGDSERPLPSGVYFLRMEASVGGEHRTLSDVRKVMVIR